MAPAISPDSGVMPQLAPPAVPGDDQVSRDFLATRAVAQRPDPWAALSARYVQPSAPPASAAPQAPPVDPSQPIGDRVVQAATATTPAAPTGFVGRLKDAAVGGAMQSLRDLASSGEAITGGKQAPEGAQPDFAKPLGWSDLEHPEDALTKAVFQVTHGLPVLAAGTTGAVLGGAGGSLVGGPVGAGGGAMMGGALGAGAMTAAQELGPYYASALKAHPADPAAAFHQAVTQAGSAGVFSAAGWALFGLKPFSGAVQNLMLQAFGVQPAVAAAGKVADNVETGQPAGQGVLATVPGAVVGTALPAIGGAVAGALTGATPPVEAPAGPAAAEGAPAPAEAPAAGAEAPPGPAAVEGAAAPPAEAAAAPGAAPVPAGAPPDGIAPAAAPAPPATADGTTAPAPASDAAAPAAEAQATPAAAAKDQAPAAPVERPDVTAIGDAKADPVTISPDVERNARAYLNGDTGKNPVQINLAYVGTDNIQDTLERVSSMLPGQGVQSHDQTTALALSLGLQPEQFLAGYKGQQLDAAQTTAMRMMLDSSAQQLVKFATAATDPDTGSPAAQAQFLRAFAAHQGIQQYFENARAEAGRTLQAYQMMSRTSSDMSKAVGDLITNAGGSDEVMKLAGRLADLNDPGKVNQAVAASRQMSARDMMLYGYYNVLLSNVPGVLAKKLTSDVLAASWEMGVRAVAALRPGAEVQSGEAAQMAYGYASSMADALRVAGRGIATGERQFEGGNTLDAVGKKRVDVLANGAPQDLPTDQPTRAAADYLKMALPTRWIGAADDFAKFLNYRAELRALAFRDATGKGLTGPDIDTQISQTLSAVPPDMHEQAVTNAIRTTFQDPLAGFTKSLSDAADQVNIPIVGTNASLPIGRMVMPFIKIPVNLTRWVYHNSPVAAVLPSANVRADWAAGGARRDMLLARVTLGSGLAGAALGFAANGMMTGRGPSDPGLNRAWRAAGNVPYTITIGGTPYSYNRVDPVGMSIGAIADTYDIMRFAPDHDRYEIAPSLAFGLGKNLLSKSYMQGMANLFDAMQSPDKGASKYVDSFAAGLLAPSAANAAENMTDPWLRAHYTMLDGIEARLPFVAQDLPIDRTLWGDPIPKQQGYLPGLSGTGVARAVSPVSYGAPAEDAEPIDKWIWNNRGEFAAANRDTLTISKPSRFQSFETGKMSVPFSLKPQQLDRFIQQAGNGLKDPETGLGAKDMLNALVTGKYPDANTQSAFDNASPAEQATKVLAKISAFRGAAQKQLIQENPDLEDTIRAGIQNRASQLSGANPVRDGASP